jgi:uncharacterized membrane-anchored protein YhcB (DUF1043 family)
LTSTVLIIPREFDSNMVIALWLIVGLSVGILMSRLEDKKSKKVPN